MSNVDKLFFAAIVGGFSTVLIIIIIMIFLVIIPVLFGDLSNLRWLFIPFMVGISVGIWGWSNAEKIEKWLDHK